MQDDKTQFQAAMLAARLVKRQRHLKKWARRTGCGAYRLYDRDIPEIPLVLDYYQNADGSDCAPAIAPATASAIAAASMNDAACAGALYKRPYEKDPREEERWLDAMKTAISGALQLPETRIFLKMRHIQRAENDKTDQYQKLSPVRAMRSTLDEPHFSMTVQETGCRGKDGDSGLLFLANLTDYIDTGIFVDMRKAHSHIRDIAKGKTVLNLFCYSGIFSVCAAAGGATAVDSVDMSATYLDWARKNFALNNLKDERCRFIRADVIRFLDEALQKRKKWDIIILDPPSFSNSKKMGAAVLDIKRDYQMLLLKCLKLLRPGGMIFFSAKARGFQFDNDAFAQSTQSCQNYYSDDIIKNVTVKNVTEAMRDEDFKGRRTPFCYIISI